MALAGDDPPSPMLEYGHSAGSRRRMRTALVVTIVVIITFAAWQRGPAAWGRMRLLYWQRQCLRYQPPADQVVYEDEPEAATALLGIGPPYVPSQLAHYAL